MYWVIQEDTHREPKFEELLQVLDRYALPYSLHKVVPIAQPGEEIEYRDAVGNWVKTNKTLIPDVAAENPIVAMGSYSLRHIAKQKGWTPGVFDLADCGVMEQLRGWGDHMLNHDLVLCHFRHFNPTTDRFFLRPEGDTKAFSGTVYDREKFLEWQRKVVDLGEDYGSGLTGNTMVIGSALKIIWREYRIWIVDGRIATACLYRIGADPVRGAHIRYDPHVDERILDFTRDRLAEWMPAIRTFVMDVCETPDGLRIVELNCLNASGYYAANMGKLVEALENAYG